MTLTSHGIIGAATASLFPSHYGLAWSFSFLSHFFADAIPHWDYSIQSSRKNPDPLANDFVLNKKSAIDLTKIGFDFSMGILLGFLLFPPPFHNPWLIIGGAFFGILPDPLQFAYWKIRREPLTSLQKLHISIHAKDRIKEWWLGVPLQIAIVATVVILSSELQLLLSQLVSSL